MTEQPPGPPADAPHEIDAGESGPDAPAAADAGGALPSIEALRRFVAGSAGRVGKREIARAFRIGPEQRPALRDLLRQLGHDGTLAPAGAKRYLTPGRLAEEMLVVVTGTDPDGDAIARPVAWQGEGPPPQVWMHREPRGQPALAPGERVIARLKRISSGRSAGKYEGRTVRRISQAPGRVLGVFRPSPEEPPRGGLRQPEAGRLVPTDRRQKAEWSIPHGESLDAEPDEVVLAEPLPQAGYGLKPARIVERLGRMGEARSISLISIHTHGIPDEFPSDVLAQAEAAQEVGLHDRTDLRDLPLVTIDGEDARDFDDAVFAEAGPDGGWRLVVAIADVAHYVPAGSELDREATRRGNSVYFPDRVVPMLPEALSNGWCSLRPRENRGCLFVEMSVGADGARHSHRFGRGLMRSAARLTYEQVQDAHDAGSTPDGVPEALLPALYGAFRALQAARSRRGTLDLDLPERRIRLDEQGRIASITPRTRLDSHRLIEEFMVLANVAAAEELQRRRTPCMFRIHAPPSPEKLDALRDFLATLDIRLKPAGELRPADLDAMLRQVADTPMAPQVNEMVLRSQSQAEYSPENIGHFGLALAEYAHFTSPIRRYADLLVHRGLIAGLGLGKDGLKPDAGTLFESLGEQVTQTERRAALAERDAQERYIAAHMADKIGAIFTARISGVTRFGLFVTLPETGATGLVPVSTLPRDQWTHDETANALTGRHSRMSYRLTQPVEVRLLEAVPVTGGLLFAPAGHDAGPADAAGPSRGAHSQRRP
ncbi:ribonuclease R [Lichenicoccus roseus]|uniref:Ribonuclease R n=1 Tax=Lichenicoccus roseus TaxID=2683649 RepID=A0A5R9JAH7_9PROT|nr:ribonuclease R [Lichenicoccus roseus]